MNSAQKYTNKKTGDTVIFWKRGNALITELPKSYTTNPTVRKQIDRKRLDILKDEQSKTTV